jgi:hypothetical protein
LAEKSRCASEHSAIVIAEIDMSDATGGEDMMATLRRILLQKVSLSGASLIFLGTIGFGAAIFSSPLSALEILISFFAIAFVSLILWNIAKSNARYKPSRQNIHIYILITLWIACAILYNIQPPEQRRALDQQVKSEQEAARTAQQAKDDRMKIVCTAKRDCEEWKDLRQSCASAGDFDKCVSVKMEATTVDPDACTRYSTAIETYPKPISEWDCTLAAIRRLTQ